MGRHGWWREQVPKAFPDFPHLTTAERKSLNACVHRIEAGYSPFDTETVVTPRSKRSIHDESTSFIFGRPTWLAAKKLDQTP